tara:strand:- start:1683 stop:2261 length:579 start_codon:yes stop_codon:yes gene_type:complete
MIKKIFVQFFLFLIILVISIFVYKKYFIKKNEIIVKEDEDTLIVKSEKSNIIKNLRYYAEDLKGNKYVITSEFGELDEDQVGLILMKNVVASINFINSEKIKIYAKSAAYDSINYDTTFSENVLIKYANHTIMSDNLYLQFDKKLATISDNVIYKNLNTELKADKVEIDLITKNSKIFMDDKSNQVQIINNK